MGITQRLGTIPLAIQTDASNNVGIGAAPSGSYKLEVTGTAKVSSTLLVSGAATFSSTIRSSDTNGLALGSLAGYRRLQYDSANTRFAFLRDDNGIANIEAGQGLFTSNNGLVLNSADAAYAVFQRSGTTYAFLGTAGSSTDIISGAANGDLAIRAQQKMLFSTGGDTERLRISSAGQLKVSANVGDDTLVVINAYSPQPYGISMVFTNSAPNNTSQYWLQCSDNVNQKAVIYTNGTFGSRTNSYGGISDIKLKENIVSATPKLDDLLKVNIVNYNFIDDENKQKQIGVIAQELEQIFPNMVYESTDKETGETSKNVKYSIFVPILVKAIQEQNQTIQELNERLNKAGL
jgi:hypothetical protein